MKRISVLATLLLACGTRLVVACGSTSAGPAAAAPLEGGAEAQAGPQEAGAPTGCGSRPAGQGCVANTNAPSGGCVSLQCLDGQLKCPPGEPYEVTESPTLCEGPDAGSACGHVPRGVACRTASGACLPLVCATDQWQCATGELEVVDDATHCEGPDSSTAPGDSGTE